MVFNKFPDVSLPDFTIFITALFTPLFGVQIGAPYSKIGLISESNRVDRALKESLERMTDHFNPKKALMAFILRSFCALESRDRTPFNKNYTKIAVVIYNL